MIERRSESRANECVVQGSLTAVGDEEGSCFGVIGSLFTLQNLAADAQASRKAGEAGGKIVGRLSKRGELRLTPRTLQLAKQKQSQGAFRSEKKWHTTYSWTGSDANLHGMAEKSVLRGNEF